jgi:LysM repeat protein
MRMRSRFLVCFAFFLTVTATCFSQSSADVLRYIDTYKQLAIVEMQRTGIPASISLAQGIHETLAGTSDLVLKSNNHFGIKCKSSWTGERVYHDDDAAGECFRSYAKAEDSYRDHSDFLKGSPRYADLFRLDPTDYSGWAFGLKRAGYATNIRYPQILVKLIEDYNLQQYTLIAMGRMRPEDEVLADNNAARVKLPVTAMTAGPPAADVQAKPAMNYPTGEFKINGTRVVFVTEGTSLLNVAEANDLNLGRLLEFNDMAGGHGDVLSQDQLVFLQRKRKTGANDTHTVQPGETMYDISQSEGIRYESLLELNSMRDGTEPASGEILQLRNKTDRRPLLVGEVRERPMDVPRSGPRQVTHHIVESKETLYSISKKYNVAVDDLIEWNRLTSQSLRRGQEILIYKN